MALDEIVQLIGPWKALHVTFVEKARRQWGVRALGLLPIGPLANGLSQLGCVGSCIGVK